MNNVGKCIKKFRMLKNLTQKQLGEKIGVSQAAIGQFESEDSNLKLETVIKIANALDIPPQYLFGDSYFPCTELDIEKSEYLKEYGEKDIQTLLGENGYSLTRVEDGYILQYTYGSLFGKKIKLTETEYDQMKKDINYFIKFIIDKLYDSHDLIIG